MIKSIKEKPASPIEIDLTGPKGNAFYLLGQAKQWLKQLSYNKEDIESIMTDMKSSDYDYLLEIFDKHFGSFVTLYR